MNKSKLIAVSLIASVMLCSCGINQSEDKPLASVTETTTATTTNIEVVVGEDKVKADASKTETTTSVKDVETAQTEQSETAESAPEDKPAETSEKTEKTEKTEADVPASESSLSADEAKKYIINTINSLKSKDFEGVLKWCNMGDIIRVSDKKNKRPMTDEEILAELKYGHYDMSDFDESIRAFEQAGELKTSDFGEPVLMSKEEIDDLNNFLKGDMFKNSNFTAKYTNGWKIPSTSNEQAVKDELNKYGEGMESLAYLYVLEDTMGEWRMDIGFMYAKVIFDTMQNATPSE